MHPVHGGVAVAEELGWFQLRWLPHWDKVDISTKELVPISIAAAVWGSKWAGKHICFHYDSMAVIASLQKSPAKSSSLMHLLRCLFLYGAFYGFQLSAEHVPGVVNTVADALSRNKADLASTVVSSQIPETQVPTHVRQLLVADRPNWGSKAWTMLL